MRSRKKLLSSALTVGAVFAFALAFALPASAHSNHVAVAEIHCSGTLPAWPSSGNTTDCDEKGTSKGFGTATIHADNGKVAPGTYPFAARNVEYSEDNCPVFGFANTVKGDGNDDAQDSLWWIDVNSSGAVDTGDVTGDLTWTRAGGTAVVEATNVEIKGNHSGGSGVAVADLEPNDPVKAAQCSGGSLGYSVTALATVTW